MVSEHEPNNDPVVYGDPGLREGFSLRRARLGASISYKRILSATVVGGFDGRYDALVGKPSGMRLVEAMVRFGRPFLAVEGGYGRVRFGRQPQASSARLALHERSIASEHMAPDRELGMTVHGGFGPAVASVLPEGFFKWAVGVHNGGGDWTGDLNPTPRLSGRARLDLGDAWTDGEAGFVAPERFALSIGGSISHNFGLEANTTTGGVDLGIRFWRIGLQGEVFVARAEPTFDTEGLPSLLSQTESLGWYGQLVVGILPGFLELAVRVDAYDDNLAVEDAGDRLDIGGGVNFYILDGRLKTQLLYLHREELSPGQETPNDSVILQMQAKL